MARLDANALDKLRAAVQRCEKPWILAAYHQEKGKPVPTSLEGTLGFLDWRLHGQVSRLIKREHVVRGSLTLVPSRRQLGRASLLVYFVPDKDEGDADVVAALKKLNAKELVLAEDTWPAPLAAKVKKSLAKAGIAWEALVEAGE